MTETDRSGFTLVEMLVSLALTALVGVLMVQALQSTGIVTQRARQASAQEEVQIVREHLRRTLAEAVRRRADGRRIPFVGLGDHLAALIAANRDVERGAELRLDLAARAQPGRPWLGLVESRSPVAGADASDDPDVLLDGIAGLRFRYFGAQEPGSAPDWQANWTLAKRVPALVEIAIDFPAGDRRRRPALVVPMGSGGS